MAATGHNTNKALTTVLQFIGESFGEPLQIRPDPLAALATHSGLIHYQFTSVYANRCAGSGVDFKLGGTGLLAVPDNINVNGAVAAADLDEITLPRATQRAD